MKAARIGADLVRSLVLGLVVTLGMAAAPGLVPALRQQGPGRQELWYDLRRDPRGTEPPKAVVWRRPLVDAWTLVPSASRYWPREVMRRIEWVDGKPLEIPVPKRVLDSAGVATAATTEVVRYESGWPVRCAVAEIAHGQPTGPGGPPMLASRSLLLVGRGSRAEQFVPRGVLWGGILADLVFWTSVAFLAWAGPRVARNGLRRSRGQCTGCGYPMRGQSRCPECGRAP